MPELPEVEVLVRHLEPLLRNQLIRAVEVRRPKVLHPTPPKVFAQSLTGARFLELSRRGKYLLFRLRPARSPMPILMIGHLGMTGRMFLLPRRSPPPKHTAILLALGKNNFIYEDTRYFGRLTFDQSVLAELGPEPWSNAFTPAYLRTALRRSSQAIKIKLLDQSLVAGVGNIYASEALFRARLSPRRMARCLTGPQVDRLWESVRLVLGEAIAWGSTVPLNWAGSATRDGLFYYGRAEGTADYYEERLMVYDRAGQPCLECGHPIKRIVQGARSTFYCPACQQG